MIEPMKLLFVRVRERRRAEHQHNLLKFSNRRNPNVLAASYYCARWVAFFLFLWVRKKLQHYSLGGPDLIIRRIFVGINPTKWVETRCCQVLCCAVPHNLKPPCWPMYKQGNICSQRGGRAVRSDDSTPELKISAISAGFLCAGFSTHAGLLVIPSLPPWYDASPA
jgi:hypothetical protein